jgi:DNA repair protein RadC
MSILINPPSVKSLYKGDRPREKLHKRGSHALTSQELWQLVLNNGIKRKSVIWIAQNLVKLLEQNSQPTKEELFELGGVSYAKAATILAVIELIKRGQLSSQPHIQEPQDVWPYVQEFAGRKQEYLVCLSLNGQHQVMTKRIISIGTLSATLIHPREIYAEALQERANSIILVHNHPSNNAQPSQADLEITALVKQAGEILGIPLLDHIIITAKGICTSINAVWEAQGLT